jgi:excisionase family DNA binding protein
MKIEFEPQDIEAIAQRVTEFLKPILANRKDEAENVIFDVQGLAEYLKVSPKWIYDRTHLKEIPHYKIRGQLRFRKREIDKWLNTYRVPAINTPEKILRAVK